MTQRERVRALNKEPVRRGKYVLYWMQAAQRAEYNHALEYAIEKANALTKPIVVLFALTDNYPDANLRHYYFMLEGLIQARNTLKARGMQLVIRHQSPEIAVSEIAYDAALVVVDAGHLRIQRRWRKTVAAKIKCPLFEVETNLIVPVDHAGVKENFSAGTFRPRVTQKLKYYLVPVRHGKPRVDSLALQFRSFNVDNVDEAVSHLDVDRTVNKVPTFRGGTTEAKRHLRNFLKNKLANYPKLRNDPNADCTSNMSPYLHFGQISPLYIALEVIRTKSPAKDAYLEELIVRRELSYNFVFYNNDYDKFKSLPPWVVRTLNFHRRDKRQYNYSLADFENARTHDPYWNAAQKQMLITGKMHGYMRMYWGKKILEWTRTPRQAFKIALYLNNKYELDGRDSNGFAGVAWCFGKHDRAWAERPVFGKVRYMNAAGLKRKFDPDQYVTRIDRLENNG
jgi:deoxyribodipyrimidine photo-lyase